MLDANVQKREKWLSEPIGAIWKLGIKGEFNKFKRKNNNQEV